MQGQIDDSSKLEMLPAMIRAGVQLQILKRYWDDLQHKPLHLDHLHPMSISKTVILILLRVSHVYLLCFVGVQVHRLIILYTY